MLARPIVLVSAMAWSSAAAASNPQGKDSSLNAAAMAIAATAANGRVDDTQARGMSLRWWLVSTEPAAAQNVRTNFSSGPR